MLIMHKVTCPSGTSIMLPHREDIVLPKGVVTRVIIRIPPGPCGLTGFRVLKGLKQVIPYNENTWLIGDDDRIEFDMYMELEEDENVFTVECYNDDQVYEHTYYFYFNVLKPEIAFMYKYLARTAYYLRGILYVMLGRWKKRRRRRGRERR